MSRCGLEAPLLKRFSILRLEVFKRPIGHDLKLKLSSPDGPLELKPASGHWNDERNGEILEVEICYPSQQPQRRIGRL